MKTTITVRTTFPGIHSWPDAPDTVAFLRDRHRHLFHVEAEIQVKHGDRELEFLTVQDEVSSWVRALPFDLGHTSCEMLAERLLAGLRGLYGSDRSYRVTVSEDGENGATVSTEEGEPL
jgi:hypothetical protein